MKTLYFDLIGGISGDMTVAALLDLGVPFAMLKNELAKLNVQGFALKRTRVARGHAKAVKFDVAVQQESRFSYQKIKRLIGKSGLGARVKEKTMSVYAALARAEDRVHGHAYVDQHFEEVGDIDSVVDIAATCICLDWLGAERLFYSVIPVNKKIAPATFELLSGKRIYFTQEIFENVTPTGMSVLAALGEQVDFSATLNYEIGRAGYGAGSFDSPQAPNVLRVAELKTAISGPESDEMLVIEANIDDMNPQFYDYLFDRLFELGAADVFMESVLMKKTRPGVLMTVLAQPDAARRLCRLILNETTTTGVRYFLTRRLKLKRDTVSIDFGKRKARVKRIVLPGGAVRLAPEYDDCKSLAQAKNLGISEAYDLIKMKAKEVWPSPA